MASSRPAYDGIGRAGGAAAVDQALGIRPPRPVGVESLHGHHRGDRRAEMRHRRELLEAARGRAQPLDDGQRAIAGEEREIGRGPDHQREGHRGGGRGPVEVRRHGVLPSGVGAVEPQQLGILVDVHPSR
jgi:hypothetical protein